MTTQTERFPLAASAPATAARSRGITIATWVVSVAAAGMFLMAGSSKLSGAPMMVALFDAIGVGQWFRYVTGTIEVVGAVALLIPAVALYAALALAATMVGAVITHLAIVGGSPAIPLVLLAGTAFVAWSRVSQR